MKTSFSFLIVFTYFILPSSGQDTKIKYGKVSPEDLNMKVYPSDTDAVAVILSKIGRVQYDVLLERYSLSEEVHTVIKIFKQAGIDEYGNAEIEYYSYNDYSKLSNVKAVVHLPGGTDIKVDNSQIFDEQTNDFWSSKKIAFPNLVPGAIIEYQYTKQSDGMFQPIDWFFQDHIPIKYAELTTKIPEWYEYVILTQGPPLDKRESGTSTEQVNTSSINRSDYTGNSREQSSINHSSAEVIFNTTSFINKDVPPLKEECCITTMDDYYTRVRFQLQAVKYPNQSRKPILDSWNKLADELYLMPEWGGQFRNKHPGELVLEAAGLNPGTSSNQLETTQKLYDYINSHIQWNEMYGYSTRRDINAILKEKSGNSGDLNKLMCAALLQSGIQAKPVLVSTRDNGKSLELYPFIDQFNHMVVLAKVDNKDMWIDLGDKNLPLGLLRPDAMNYRGWVVEEEESYWTEIVPVDSKSIFLIKGSIDQEGNFNGNIETRFTGYHALQQRNTAEVEKEKFGDRLISCGSNDLKLEEKEMINTNESSKPFQVKAKFVNQPMATATPDKLYINPVFPRGLDQNPFKLVTREYPIEMNYPEEISMILNLALPGGYIVESLPEPIRFVTESGGIQVTYEAKQSTGILNISMKYMIKQLEFDPSEYEALKNFFNQRQQKLSEQIVLTKS